MSLDIPHTPARTHSYHPSLHHLQGHILQVITGMVGRYAFRKIKCSHAVQVWPSTVLSLGLLGNFFFGNTNGIAAKHLQEEFETFKSGNPHAYIDSGSCSMLVIPHNTKLHS